MKRILCYGDSNTWAYNVNDPNEAGECGRYPEHVRWTSLLSDLLGPEYTVLEEGFNGRTTVFEDYTSEGRSGLAHFEVAFRSQEPLDLIIFMLGTNDCKDMFGATALNIANGMERLAKKALCDLRFSISRQARLLIVSPIAIAPDKNGSYQYGFSSRSREVAAALHEHYSALAKTLNCAFLDASLYASPCAQDGVHLDEAGHRALAEAIFAKVAEMLP